jgi:SAM-dependent methyltransferase
LRDLSDQDSSDRHAVRVTIESYSQLATSYVSATRDFTQYPGLDAEIRNFVSRLPTGVVVDVGSGSGRDAAFSAGLGRRVVAIDPSYAMLHTLTASEPRVAMLCGDVFALPVRSHSFAGAIVSGVLLHLPRKLCPEGSNRD